MRYLCTTLLAAALTASPAFAQEELNDFGPDQGDWELALSGSGNNDEEFEVGDASINFDLGYYLTEEWIASFRQSASYADTGEDHATNASTRVALDYQFDTGNLRPFLGVNIGYIYGEGVNDTWAAGPEAGLKWYVKDETFIFGRAEYQFFFEDSDEVDEAFDDGQFIYTIGIGFNF